MVVVDYENYAVPFVGHDSYAGANFGVRLKATVINAEIADSRP